MTDLERAILHIKTRADAWAVKEVEKALSQEPCIYDLKNRYCPRLNEHGMLKYPLQEPTIGQLFSCEEVEELRSKIWKQVEQEPCADAVSREAVKELIKSGVSTDTYDDVEQVCKWIDALPSVTQKSGKWIKKGELWECSVCGDWSCCHESYCNNCGAKMESEDKK